MNTTEAIIMQIRESAKANHFLRVLGVLLLSLALTVTGCASGGDDLSKGFPDLTLEEAREIQNAQLQEFIDLVPADQVTEVWGPIPEMAAMSCDTDLGGYRPFWKERTGSYQLPGGSKVYVQDTMDVLAWFDEVASRQQALEWDSRREDKYWEELWLYAPNGFDYVLTYFPRQESRGAFVRIDSFSPCFIPPSDLSLHERY